MHQPARRFSTKMVAPCSVWNQKVVSWPPKSTFTYHAGSFTLPSSYQVELTTGPYLMLDSGSLLIVVMVPVLVQRGTLRQRDMPEPLDVAAPEQSDPYSRVVHATERLHHETAAPEQHRDVLGVLLPYWIPAVVPEN